MLTSARVNTLDKGLGHARIGSILRRDNPRYVVRVYTRVSYCPELTLQSRLRSRVERRARRLQGEGFTTELGVVAPQSSRIPDARHRRPDALQPHVGLPPDD
jgi:hypothetical protein